jgi:hypothetical protein
LCCHIYKSSKIFNVQAVPTLGKDPIMEFGHKGSVFL